MNPRDKEASHAGNLLMFMTLSRELDLDGSCLADLDRHLPACKVSGLQAEYCWAWYEDLEVLRKQKNTQTKRQNPKAFAETKWSDRTAGKKKIEDSGIKKKYILMSLYNNKAYLEWEQL